MLFRKRLLAVALIVSTLLPYAAEARMVTEIVTKKEGSVTRSEFLTWSTEALGLLKNDAKCTLPYTRSPRGLRKTLCLALGKGVLRIFGTSKQYPLGRPISRGEALQVLTLLTDKHETADISKFTDVKTEAEKRAVQNAIALKWMNPGRATVFGLSDKMTGSEVMSLLQAAVDETPIKGTGPITITIQNTPSKGILPKQQLLDSIWQILSRDYLKAEGVKDEEAAYQAAEALAKSVGDPYTTFFRPASAENFQQQLKGELTGIGAQVEEKGGIIIVVSPIPGSPAERAGILAGDEILEADGHALSNIGVDRAVQFIRGEKGTTVQLKLRRGGVEMQQSVVRDTISLPEITVKMQGDIAIVQLAQFGETTVNQIRSTFEELEKKSPKGIVLDLRNNGGGLLSAASLVMSNFVPRDTIFAHVESASDTREERTEYGPTVNSGRKLVVLINKASASASEIVAAALQDLKRATIVGATSYGKGTVQEVISFPTGEALKVTVAEWLSPLNRHIDGIGVKPDIVVESDDRDVQLKKAVDLLR